MKFVIKKNNESALVKGGNWIQLHQTAAHTVELDQVPECFLQLVVKRYSLKAVRTLVKKKKGEAVENYSRHTKPTWEHKACSGNDSIICAM